VQPVLKIDKDTQFQHFSDVFISLKPEVTHNMLYCLSQPAAAEKE